MRRGDSSIRKNKNTAATSEATVTLEVRARFALTQNAWYIASAGVSPL